MGWKSKAGENKLHKKVGAAEDTFHHCFGLGDAGLVLVLEMLWNQGINLERYLLSFKTGTRVRHSKHRKLCNI